MIEMSSWTQSDFDHNIFISSLSLHPHKTTREMGWRNCLFRCSLFLITRLLVCVMCFWLCLLCTFTRRLDLFFSFTGPSPSVFCYSESCFVCHYRPTYLPSVLCSRAGREIGDGDCQPVNPRHKVEK